MIDTGHERSCDCEKCRPTFECKGCGVCGTLSTAQEDDSGDIYCNDCAIDRAQAAAEREEAEREEARERFIERLEERP